MIYRPAPDVSGKVHSGLYFSSTPEKELGKGGDFFQPSVCFPGSLEPLTDEDRALIAKYWAVNAAKSTKFPDCFGTIDQGYFAASKDVADAIEELEPGVHQIVKIPRVWAQGDSVEIDRPYYFVRICQALQCLDMERSNIVEGKERRTGIKFKWLNSYSADTCFVIEDTVKGRHLWIDELVCSVFISQELYERLKEVGCLGIEFTKTTSV